ncbi:uncharacterized protein LOC134247184 [Saccostrea cucullata]|uniref:uncharacterized protein LOC134247184 n=1 Tax=Saccostrea cuccullata TaxID=36930 RepID=UPI002ED5B5A2
MDRFVVVCLLVFCPVIKAAQFESGHHVGTVTSHSITEASGICASRTHHDVLYTHNDSGGTHRIFAISATSGHRLATIYINGAHSQDWEDIACGPCPGGSGHCIYISDTGGNAGYDANTIYRIREPSSIHDQSVNLDGTLEFSWDQHDCETLLVDPRGEVYVVSKVGPGHHGKFVHLPSSAWNQHHHVWVNDGVYLPITASSNSPVGGDISPLGTEILLKTYGHVYYWHIPDGNYEAHIHNQPQALPYRPERQGEAVCWKADNTGYYTLSEGANQSLNFYRRISAIPSGSVVG